MLVLHKKLFVATNFATTTKHRRGGSGYVKQGRFWINANSRFMKYSVINSTSNKITWSIGVLPILEAIDSSIQFYYRNDSFSRFIQKQKIRFQI